MEEILQQRVNWSLNQYLYSNAVFLAERLYSEFPNENNLFIIAEVYYRMGKVRQAYRILQMAGSQLYSNSNNRYLFALCCYSLSKFIEAEEVLTSSSSYKGRSINLVPNGSSGLFLLGMVYKQQNRNKEASKCFKLSFQKNPFMWVSFQELSKLEENLKIDELFLDPNTFETISFPSEIPNLSQIPHNTITQISNEQEIVSPIPNKSNYLMNIMETPQTVSHKNISRKKPSKRAITFSKSSIKQKQKQKTFTSLSTPLNTPKNVATQKPFIETPYFTPVANNFVTPSPTVRQPQMPKLKTKQKQRDGLNQPVQTVTLKFEDEKTKKEKTESKKIESKKIESKKTESKNNNNNLEELEFSMLKPSTKKQKPVKTRKTKAPSHNFISHDPKTPNEIGHQKKERKKIVIEKEENEKAEKMSKGINEYLGLIRVFAEAYGYLTEYKCEKSIEKFKSLQPCHFASGWVLSQVARAYFELSQFQQSYQMFEKARKIAPYMTKDMEIYSTVLWHLHKDYELSHLANDLILLDRMCPETWCAIGNCFSLQKEHETAIKFFQRAVQLNPYFAYAYTLSGHEYITRENFEKALSFFRRALSVDHRHWNAWYGLGSVYMHQEKFELALYHFKRALDISDNSSILHCYYAMALYANQKVPEALNSLKIAIKKNPNNAVALFKKANILFDLYDNKGAEKILLNLRENVPKESGVHLLLGRVYKREKRWEEAIDSFSVALDLDPKTNKFLKNEIENIGEFLMDNLEEKKEENQKNQK
ncbi:cell division cycle protein 27 [Anaeramoeba ignava]|uniref:Cell division cycle protein 27 n=1 Tax=Anaeramoeba ignava TaxID=1746090 RepID=A0A9Q0LD75_ANAIG|nr:cell division cycle protein 27 [Anaeramoeba ignava]